MGFRRYEYWSGLSFSSPGYPPETGIEPVSPELQANSLPLSHQGSPLRAQASNERTFFFLSGEDMKDLRVFTILFLGLFLSEKFRNKRTHWKFLGGPVVKTPGFHCQGHGFDLWSEN